MEVLQGPLTGTVPVPLKHHISFHLALMSQLHIWHFYWLIPIQSVGNLHSQGVQMLHFMSHRYVVPVIETHHHHHHRHRRRRHHHHHHHQRTLTRIIWCKFSCISTSLTITRIMGEQHVAVNVHVFHEHWITNEPCCTLCVLDRPTVALYHCDI